jgi:hypothetical protein
LQAAMRSIANTKQSIGNYFLNQGLITESQLLTALSAIKHIQYYDILNMDDYNLTGFAPFFDRRLLRDLLVAPLLKTETGFVIAFCDNSPINAQTILRTTYDITIHAVFASQETIEKALDRIYSPAGRGKHAYSRISALYAEGIINYEQAIIAYNYKNAISVSENEILRYMGLLPGGK